MTLLQVRGLRQEYRPRRGGAVVPAVRGVDLDLDTDQTLGLVGESGCGKSSLARAVLQLPPPTAGSVMFDGTELVGLPDRRLRRLRAEMAVVFQDPYASFDPRMSVAQCLAEPVRVQRRPVDRDRIAALLDRVGLNTGLLGRYPHELSGGQRQRVALARALVLDPRLLVLDEALSAVDVSVQAGLIRLVRDLRAERGLAQLFIGHDLGVIRQVADRIAVMFAGRLVEVAPARTVLEHPAHPYTAELLAAAPDLRAGPSAVSVAATDTGFTTPPGSGCRYRRRCPLATRVCEDLEPELEQVAPGHVVACHHAQPAGSQPEPAHHQPDGEGDPHRGPADEHVAQHRPPGRGPAEPGGQ